MTATDRDPATYLRPGGVFVPAVLARPLFALLVPSLAAQARTDCTPPRDDLLGVLDALNVVDVASEQRPVSEFGTVPTQRGRLEDMRTPDDAGAEVGLSGRRVRQLCVADRVTHRASGARGYLVDVDSLRAYLHGAP